MTHSVCAIDPGYAGNPVTQPQKWKKWEPVPQYKLEINKQIVSTHYNENRVSELSNVAPPFPPFPSLPYLHRVGNRVTK